MFTIEGDWVGALAAVDANGARPGARQKHSDGVVVPDSATYSAPDSERFDIDLDVIDMAGLGVNHRSGERLVTHHLNDRLMTEKRVR